MANVVFDPFEALGLPRDATASAIKAQYHALARKYHPNRHHRPCRASEAAHSPSALRRDLHQTWWRENTDSLSSDYFHNIHQAWKLLSKADNRRRTAELLNLLELQDQMEAAFVDLLNAENFEEHSAEREKHDEHHEHSDLDGHISSDADEDLPNVGLQRRQTFANRNVHVVHLGDQTDAVNSNSPTSPTKRHIRVLSKLSRGRSDHKKDDDYFTQRRKKLEKLRRKELEAFRDYRDAMVTKFEAEEDAEKRHEHYERAKWKREYFERAPRGTTERFRSFQQFMGAVTAFGTPTVPRERNRSDGSYATMTPVVGPGENGFLFPESGLSRQKTTHRRGWSSDISGDQSDSSDHDDSGEVNGWRRTPPLSAFRRHSRRPSDTGSLDTFRAPGAKTSTPPLIGTPNQPSGLKIIVRQPTDLGITQEAQDSSGDTISGSSRSPSPQPSVNAIPSGRYMWLPSSGPAEYFGLDADRRARSPSPVGQRRMQSPATREDVTKIAYEGLQFATKSIGAPHHHQIPLGNVYELKREEKAWMLGTEPDNENDPEALLDRLQQLDANVAAKFMVKPDIKELFRFRLIYSHRQIASKDNQSFIALSYRRKLHVTRHHNHFTLPLEPEIFQAVWEERQSDHEGLWIDQICIDQESREETTVSMSAMDMVYRSARLVVVALDDIELDQHEGELLNNHMSEYNAMTHVLPGQRFRRKQPPYLESHENLFRVIRKILRSSWFKRAWCRHEMRLAKHHIFLIPCKRPGSWSGRDVLRFNGKCISHLLDLSTEVPFEPDVESVKPALHAFFRDRSKMAPDERGMQLHHGNFSTVVAEVFAMEAGGDPRIPAEQREADARKDKIAIILNTMECGLTISERFRDPMIHLSQNECYHDLMLVSLAAQDPGALCAVGAPLPITDAVHSWLYTPTVADSGLNNTKTLQRLPDRANIAINTSGPEHFVQLDLNFLKSGRREHHPLDPDALQLAENFIRVCDERKFGRNRKRYLTHDRKANLLFGPMEEVYRETLACVFICGPDWMSDVCQRYSMSRWRVDLKGAYELMVALQNTCGRWPSHAWNTRAAAFIMDFVNFLVIRGLPQRQILKPEKWRPVWVPTVLGGKVVTFVPDGNRHIRPAIPTTLMNPDYMHLARLWILQPRPLPKQDRDLNLIPNHEEWTLLGKSVLFSDDPSIRQMTSYDGFLKEEQKIHGRRRLATNGVHQEGSI
ncbi:Putative DnaJ domain, heterokaryon incompatibility, Chaperone J-domain superfamily [Septoria linicola]|uniref:DnaJ domain, heterokaryon incompatibility, Chaperone J-domain superfamily n=1 Tax=Septoria linicola TaxID=215465 RepID=A0A9Q9ATC2_9PEZI|nr:putative DnaJ domain, heterokaryon incompatibility, Chaperone J-domain superfamily [Septoria linicola]USW50381.1 Putative DnaJ domain, heterokaryon incompatibility, Chaperone J-domain superfamily [Septoria linicola]